MSIDPSQPAVDTSDEGVTRVTFTGEVDELVAAALAQLWTKILGPSQQIELDLGAVTFFNSAAIAALLQGHDQAQTMNSTITITHASPIVVRVLQITGVDHLLAPTVDQEC